VLGADDGLVSTAALLIGVAASGANRSSILTAGVAALTAGAMAMAIGEWVSVSAQADTEQADRLRESSELHDHPEAELRELTSIYVRRGLGPELAARVAAELQATDPLGAHLRDELGHTPTSAARPVQAAATSAVSFAAGAAVPLLTASVGPPGARSVVIAAVTLLALCALGALGAALGGARRWRATLRVGIGGAAAMALTYAVGALFGGVT
jgi:VIT1/CCC1 family predicted Fe2+/Mn2+ transporter